MQMNFYDHLERYCQAVALTAMDGTSLSYESAAVHADSFASHLNRNGLVFILPGNNIPSVIAYLGWLREGPCRAHILRNSSGPSIKASVHVPPRLYMAPLPPHRMSDCHHPDHGIRRLCPPAL